MKKKLFTAFIGIGIVMGTFTASANSCRAAFFACVESGTSEYICETQYKACRGY